LAALESFGVQLHTGDLKDPNSLSAACNQVDAIISTASSTLSRQEGDSIQSVDLDGQLNLVRAATGANVARFVSVSFRRPAVPFPLSKAKEAVENALMPLNFTIIQASWFMEVWLTAALGFDYANSAARIYGAGTAPISWVSYRDVAEMCALALRHPGAERAVIPFGGPEQLSPLDVVARFEAIAHRPFKLEHVPEDALRAQMENAGDALQQSFAGLMLAYAHGDAIEMKPVLDKYPIKLTSVDEYARKALASVEAI
jgi:uncharacterized protein YbjT (DUF2867 family)